MATDYTTLFREWTESSREREERLRQEEVRRNKISHLSKIEEALRTRDKRWQTEIPKEVAKLSRGQLLQLCRGKKVLIGKESLLDGEKRDVFLFQCPTHGPQKSHKNGRNDHLICQRCPPGTQHY